MDSLGSSKKKKNLIVAACALREFTNQNAVGQENKEKCTTRLKKLSSVKRKQVEDKRSKKKITKRSYKTTRTQKSKNTKLR